MTSNTKVTPLEATPSHVYMLGDQAYKCLESNEQAIQYHLDNDKQVFSTEVVKTGEDGERTVERLRHWVAIEDYIKTPRSSKKQAMIDKLMAKGFTLDEALEIVE